ncbi:MAG: ABC transporter permease [Pseudomonadota bacterium]
MGDTALSDAEVSTTTRIVAEAGQRPFLPLAFDALASIYRHRSEIRTLFMRDFNAALRRTRLGGWWNVINSLVPIFAYMILNLTRVFNQAEGIHPAAYVAMGVTLWLLLSDTLTLPMLTAERGGVAMNTARLPVFATLFAGFGRIAFGLMVRLPVALGLVLWFHPVSLGSALVGLLLLILGAIFFYGCGLILCLLNLMLPDIRQGVMVALRYLIFVSGAVFPLNDVIFFDIFNMVNPFYIFIDATRATLVFGVGSGPASVWILGVLGICLVVIGAGLVARLEPHIREAAR